MHRIQGQKTSKCKQMSKQSQYVSEYWKKMYNFFEGFFFFFSRIAFGYNAQTAWLEEDEVSYII